MSLDRSLPSVWPATPDRPRAGRRLSEFLKDLATDESRSRISVGDLLEAMNDRAIAALMFVFALPNVFPTPPGTSSVLAAPLILLACQLALGVKPWLPRVMAVRSISRGDFEQFVRRASPWLLRIEALLRPRLRLFTTRRAEQLVALVCLVLALILVLPVPLGNMLPALAICLLALGILERDGAWVVAGLSVALISMVTVAGVVYGIALAANALLEGLGV